MSRVLAAALEKLLQAEDALPQSALTAAQRRALDEWGQRTRAVRVARQGRGVVYRALSLDVIRQHLRELAPDPAAAQDASLPARAANLARHRATKAGAHGHRRDYLLLKAAHGSLWHDANGRTLALDRQTEAQGAAVLAVGGGMPTWRSEGALWLVENQALFDRLDWLPTPATVAWYRGQVSGALLDWLEDAPRADMLWHFPDYDGVGLQNYSRLRRRLGAQVRFWLMPDWEVRLQRYGNGDLWRKTLREFESAVNALGRILEEEEALVRLIDTMRTLGRALEQEAVWL